MGFVPKIQETIQTTICNLKGKEPENRKKDVVYGIQCQTCDQWYIGETCQRIEDRLKQHKRAVRKKSTENGIYEHIRQNKGHRIDWESMRILHKESHWRRRKIGESIFIDVLNPMNQLENIMNLDRGRAMHSCWKTFYHDVKNAISPLLGGKPDIAKDDEPA